MVSQDPREGRRDDAKKRRVTDALVRRSPSLSLGAKALWSELNGWAWSADRTCFPHQKILADALSTTRRTIIRWLEELEAHGLIEIERLRYGNRYRLMLEVPDSVCDLRRADNKWLAHQHRGDEDGQIVTSEDMDPAPRSDTGVTSGGEISATTSDTSIIPDVTPASHGSSRCDAGVTSDVTPASPPRKYRKEEGKKEEKKEREVQDAERSVTASPHASERASLSGDEDTQGTTPARICSLGVLMPEEDAVEDLGDLLEDDAPRRKKPARTRKTKFQQRAPDLLPGLPGSGLRTAHKAPGGTKEVRIEPPTPETEEDVLRLLRGEVEEKFGKQASRGLSDELTAKERGQIRNTVLRKYPPDVVLAMIRVLVWDWKIARTTFFPYRPDQAIPLVENLIQYAKHLAAAITTGLEYSGDHRGAVNSYYDIYLRGEEKQSTDRPF